MVDANRYLTKLEDGSIPTQLVAERMPVVPLSEFMVVSMAFIMLETVSDPAKVTSVLT